MTDNDPNWPDIADHPIDEAEYHLYARAPHYDFEWERLCFRHKVTGQTVFRKRKVKR